MPSDPPGRDESGIRLKKEVATNPQPTGVIDGRLLFMLPRWISDPLFTMGGVSFSASSLLYLLALAGRIIPGATIEVGKFHAIDIVRMERRGQ
jgi:hypothetical protein